MASTEKNRKTEQLTVFSSNYLFFTTKYASCATVSSKIETFHPAGKLLKEEGKQLKEIKEIPETNQIHKAPSCRSKQ